MADENQGSKGEISITQEHGWFGKRRGQFERNLPTANKIVSEYAEELKSKITKTKTKAIKTRRNAIKALVVEQEAGEIDVDTNIPNKKGFERRFQDEVNWARSNKEKLAILFMDVNELKKINDTALHKHLSGNQLIKAVAEILSPRTYGDYKGQIRRPDIVARWVRGDEFVVLLPNTDLKDVEPYWKRKDEMFGNYSNPEFGLGPIWIAAGAAQVDINNPSQSLENAMHAMHEAKETAKLDPEGRYNVLQIASDTSTIV